MLMGHMLIKLKIRISNVYLHVIHNQITGFSLLLFQVQIRHTNGDVDIYVEKAMAPPLQYSLPGKPMHEEPGGLQ